jgi:hypothetical protein
MLLKILKLGFLRRNSNGTTGYNFLKNSGPIKDEAVDEENENESEEEESEAAGPIEKPLTIGNLLEGLQANSWTMASFNEDKKIKTKPSNV